MTENLPEDHILDEDKITKEEMNIAEYPITLLAKRVPKGLKTIEYNDWVTIKGEKKPLRWVVTGSDKYGLPTGEDQDFFLAIMEVWRRYGFKDRAIPIGSIYAMLKEMELPTTGKHYYDRFRLSLDRFTGMYISTENAFWDKENKCYISKYGFHIFDEYKLYDRFSRKNTGMPLPLGYVKASDFFYDSIKKGNLKELNLSLYLKLPTSLSRRLYRYLDKKRYFGKSFSMNIYKLAGKLGLAPTKTGKYYPSKLKQLLNPALESLKSENFLERHYYQKGKDGEKLCVAFYQSGGNSGGLDLRSADLLDRILEFTGDDHSRGYYIKLIRELGPQRVESVLSETKQAYREHRITTTQARYFTDLAERYLGHKPI